MENKSLKRSLMDDTFFNNKNSYLTFSLEEDVYGISIISIKEIIGMQSITKVPGMPKFITGIINLRGKIIPVMDLRTRFEKPVVAYNDRTCIIIVEMDNVSLGLIVDTVLEVVNIEEEKITLPPKINSYDSNFINKIGQYQDKVALLLSCDKLLTQTEINKII